jgi:KamA family protein
LSLTWKDRPSAAATETDLRYRAITSRGLDQLAVRAGLSERDRLRLRAVASVLPFKTNTYVVDELIDWSSVPDDPIFRLVVPNPEMLPEQQIAPIMALLEAGAPNAEVQAAAARVRAELNPHPGDQQARNIPLTLGRNLDGVQHKYAETVLLFPERGQTCHAYCTYCFRWAQFVHDPSLRIALDATEAVWKYLADQPSVQSALITGGDPLIMRTDVLDQTVSRLLEPELEHIRSIRIGSKALSFWPHRFLTDPDADELLALFERVIASGRTLSLMAHFSHPRELMTDALQRAVARVRSTGAQIYTQAPVIRGINDEPEVWRDMWTRQVGLGMVPYYMFVERDTGPHEYFRLPLARCLEVYRGAIRATQGLCRTVRGPVMSASEGKVAIDGVTELEGRDVFVLRYIQARDPERVQMPFFAEYDPDAAWWSELRPARPADAPYFDVTP